MSADKYPSIFSRQMKAIVYIIPDIYDMSKYRQPKKGHMVVFP